MANMTAARAKALQKPGRYGAGGGLYLRVRATKVWVQRITVNGVRRDITIGPFDLVSLAEARMVALQNRRVLWEGKDPIAERRRGGVPTFRAAAERTLAERRANWRGDRYAEAWERTLARYVLPTLGAMRVDAIRGDDVLRVLFHGDLWNRKPTTAQRVRQQIRTVLGWAQAREFVERNAAGEAIDGALPKRRRRAKSHRALPHAEVRELLANVEESRSRAAVRLCLRFLILTAARSGEARGARWSEIDVDRRTWTVPGERMKAGKEHRVPLSPQAVAVLEAARQLRSRKGCDLVFPGRSGERELKDMALTNALWSAGVGERATVHGFRSTFSDWSAERGNAPMLAEAALAHTVQGVEGAYRRTDLFEERRPVMDAWGEYVGAVAQDSEAARNRIGNRPPDRVGIGPENIDIATAAGALGASR